MKKPEFFSICSVF